MIQRSTARNPNQAKTCDFRLLPHSKPPEVNQLDHQIGLRNGSTSVLEFSPRRVQLAKLVPRPTPSARIEELTRELGQMRQEIQFYRQCFEILQRLRDKSYGVYQQIFLEHYLDPGSDRMGELMTQLHHALEESVRHEAAAKRAWIGFWGRESNEIEDGGWI
jgi:hypothetical protein